MFTTQFDYKYLEGIAKGYRSSSPFSTQNQTVKCSKLASKNARLHSLPNGLGPIAAQVENGHLGVWGFVPTRSFAIGEKMC